MEEPSKPVEQFKFWNTQPVPKLGEVISENTYINPPIPISQVQQKPYELKGDFRWVDVDLTKDEELKELYDLLSLNYAEDDDHMFGLHYSPDFLKWALMPPRWRKVWHCGVRGGENNRLVAFIGAIPCHLQVHEKDIKSVQINFLCVHKKLRSKRLAPLLIKEITRRVNLKGIFQAVFTADVVIPKPVARAHYWHRALHVSRMIDFGLLQSDMSKAQAMKTFSLEKPSIKMVKLEEKHVKSAYKLLMGYLKNYKLYPRFTEDEFKHFMLPRENIIYSYVLVDDNQKVTDLCSFYNLPSTVVNHPERKQVKAAYSFYNVARTISFKDLMQNSLVMAKRAGFDVFNALDVLDNNARISRDTTVLGSLNFCMGKKPLQYYLYNWKCPDLSPNEVGFVLQ